MVPVERYALPDLNESVADLRARIARTRWPTSISAEDWSRGVPTQYLKTVSEYWLHQFDWSRWQAELRALPHFRTEILGQPIHFLHFKSARAATIPLVMTHGWPSSFLEFQGVVQRLTNGDTDFGFDLVIPSLPGFGFSSPLMSFGWNHRRIAAAWAELMTLLGYERFAACGGDTGSIVAPALGQLFPDRVIGVHINGGLLQPKLTAQEYDALTDDERRRIDFTSGLLRLGTGYADLQSTRPQSVGFALNDSPVGLLGWMIDKYKEWTDPKKALPEDAIALDHILSTISLYWITGTAASSANLYFEVRHENETLPALPRTGVPVGVAVFPTDPILRQHAGSQFNIVHWSEYERGGHFAAFEAPDLYAQDLFAFVRTVLAGTSYPRAGVGQ